MKLTKRIAILAMLVSLSHFLYAQVIPEARRTDWTLAGLRHDFPPYTNILNIEDFGGIGDSITDNVAALNAAIASSAGKSAVIFFPAGKYLFQDPIQLQDSIVLRGETSHDTQLLFDLGGNIQDMIYVNGTKSATSSSILVAAFKDDQIIITQNEELQVGDYLLIQQNDSALITSDWAIGTVGQITFVTAIEGDTIHLASPLRKDYLSIESPKVTKMSPMHGVGIECLGLKRLDATAPQSININFTLARDCWVRGVESHFTNFGHVGITRSTNIEVSGCYFHDAYAFGGGGQAYGVILQFTSGECLIENNQFRRLRHSMLLQAGANGNVLAYNYSTDPLWASFPANAAADLVLHGNYPFMNLLEGNIVQNIAIDNSHGLNGPYNTFFRNRAALYGIVMSNVTSAGEQNLIGNEITNSGFLLGNFFVYGNNHILYANNDNGVLSPANTDSLLEASLFLETTPDYWPWNEPYPNVGFPYFDEGTLDAKIRYENAVFGTCSGEVLGFDNINKNNNYVHPNPASQTISVMNEDAVKKVEIFDILGGLRLSTAHSQGIDISQLPDGIYICVVNDKVIQPIKFVKF